MARAASAQPIRGRRDELLILGRGHGPYLSQVQTLFKCIDHWTSPERVARAKLRQVDQAARQGSHDPPSQLSATFGC